MRHTLFVLLLPFCVFAEPATSPICVQFDDTPHTLRMCNNQIVKFTVKMSNDVRPHPTGKLDKIDLKTNQIIRMHETYVDFGNPPWQIVLASGEPIICSGNIKITGVVRMVDLGGTEGTKQEYATPWIEVQNYNCN